MLGQGERLCLNRIAYPSQRVEPELCRRAGQTSVEMLQGGIHLTVYLQPVVIAEVGTRPPREISPGGGTVVETSVIADDQAERRESH
jgi:hypothetical protein